MYNPISINNLIRLSFISFLIGIFAIACKNPSEKTTHTNKYEFYGAPSKSVLEAYLSRAITMSDFFHDYMREMDIHEGIRMLTNVGAKFIGRVAFVYANEETLENTLELASQYSKMVHNADPEIIIQAAIFEIVSPKVNNIDIPSFVFTAFGDEIENRKFNYQNMLFDPDGEFAHNTNVFGQDLSVPDITQKETQYWYFFLAASYINAGLEAIHLGIFDWVTEADYTKEKTASLLSLIRDYAKQNAKRGWVFLDAHTHGIKRNDSLLLDFHSFPLLPVEGSDSSKALLQKNFLTSIYNKSKGGISPSGWSCSSLPYLAEFDHGYSMGSIQENTDENFIWGYDEITWFASINENARNAFLEYAYNWIKENDENGYLQMPGMRAIWVNFSGHDEDFYYANMDTYYEKGYNQEKTIKMIWSEN